ncbi:MAG: type II secretion system F family protein [Nitriliruptoraceae bacterium]
MIGPATSLSSLSTLALLAAGLALWWGATLLLASIGWFSRRPLVERLGPYARRHGSVDRRPSVLSAESLRDTVVPVAQIVGERFSRLLGALEDPGTRLRRTHATTSVAQFRVRQVGWALAGAGAGAFVALTTRPPLAAAAVFVVGGLLLGFALVEQQLATASERHRAHLRQQLPVVSEQIGMYVAAGFSVSQAVERVARRGEGACARDLRRVLVRIRHGVDERTALTEWAHLADVDAVTRLVAVLSLDRQASDLGRLIATEARNIRRDLHRDLLAAIERRGQQVWIPVTVATLLPGAIFIAVPFSSAVSGFLTG